MADIKNTAKWLLIFIGVAALIIGAEVLIAKFMQEEKKWSVFTGTKTTHPL